MISTIVHRIGKAGRIYCERRTDLRPDNDITTTVDILRSRLVHIAERRLDFTLVNLEPKPLEWVESAGIAQGRHVSLALVYRGDGTRTYIDALPRSELRQDPTIRGTRAGIEAACAARHATFEIWTEREIDEDEHSLCLARTADLHQRTAYAGAQLEEANLKGIVRGLAARLSLTDVRPVDGGWAGRSTLTRILMAFLFELSDDPVTRITIWRPNIGAARRSRHLRRPFDAAAGPPSPTF